MDVIYYPLGDLLRTIYNFVNISNPQIVSAYALTIIIATVILRTFMMPFTYQQIKTSKKMESVKGELDNLKQKYSTDSQEFNTKMLELYKEKNINPLSSFLPVLIQLPVMLSFYKVLSNPQMYAFRNSDVFTAMDKSFFWIHDLSYQAKYVLESGLTNGLSMQYSLPVIGSVIPLLALLVAITTYINSRSLISKKNAVEGNVDLQMYLTLIMPVMLFMISQSLPSGLLLYWFVGNIFQYFQQVIVAKLPRMRKKATRMYSKITGKFIKERAINGG